MNQVAPSGLSGRYPWIISCDTSRSLGSQALGNLCAWVHFDGPNTGLVAVLDSELWFSESWGPFFPVVFDQNHTKKAVALLRKHGLLPTSFEHAALETRTLKTAAFQQELLFQEVPR